MSYFKKTKKGEVGYSAHMKQLEKAHLGAMTAHYEALGHYQGNETARAVHQAAVDAHANAYMKAKKAGESMRMVGNEAVQNKLDKQGGELPVIDRDDLQHADFVTLPKGIPGTNCSNCRFVKAKGDGHVCTNENLEGQAVTNRNCCAYWDATGTLREWERDTTNNSEGQPMDEFELALATVTDSLGLTVNAKQPSAGLDMTADKACKILHDKMVNGHKLTQAQRGMFGAKCGTHNSEYGMYGDSPKEMTKRAAVASMEHPEAREHAIKAVDAVGNGRFDLAARHHGKAAEVHDRMATEARKDKEPGEAEEHDRIAMMHRQAKSVHEAGVRNSEGQTTNNSNNRSTQEQPMTRDQKLAALTVNCSCDKERAVFNEMSDQTLDAVFKATVQNGQPSKSSPSFQDTQGGGSKQAGGEEDADDKSKPNKATHNSLTLTSFEAMLAASPEAQSVWNTAKQITQRHVEDMVRKLVANVRDDNRKREIAANLLKKSPTELQAMLELLPPAQAITPVANQQGVQAPQIDFSFLGAGGGPHSMPVTNAAETPVEVTEEWMPTLNYAEMVAEQKAGKRSA